MAVISSPDIEFEEQLAGTGGKLVDPPASLDDLLTLLDQVENLLTRVDQSPSDSMLSVLAVPVRALAGETFFKHPDVDVRVAVASCISELTRITTPNIPYRVYRMKDAFELIVSSFENLSDKSSRSYAKRCRILQTTAKRCIMIMLDPELDWPLIHEMFHHFLREIREYHPENVFSAMETIMTLVIIEETEDKDLITQLICSILIIMEKDNEEVLPIARKLGEKVLKNCALKLKTYLPQLLKSLGVSSDDYDSRVLSSICHQESITNELDKEALEVHDHGNDVENHVMASACKDEVETTPRYKRATKKMRKLHEQIVSELEKARRREENYQMLMFVLCAAIINTLLKGFI